MQMQNSLYCITTQYLLLIYINFFHTYFIMKSENPKPIQSPCQLTQTVQAFDKLQETASQCKEETSQLLNCIFSYHRHEINLPMISQFIQNIKDFERQLLHLTQQLKEGLLVKHKHSSMQMGMQQQEEELPILNYQNNHLGFHKDQKKRGQVRDNLKLRRQVREILIIISSITQSVIRGDQPFLKEAKQFHSIMQKTFDEVLEKLATQANQKEEELDIDQTNKYILNSRNDALKNHEQHLIMGNADVQLLFFKYRNESQKETNKTCQNEIDFISQNSNQILHQQQNYKNCINEDISEKVPKLKKKKKRMNQHEQLTIDIESYQKDDFPSTRELVQLCNILKRVNQKIETQKHLLFKADIKQMEHCNKNVEQIKHNITSYELQSNQQVINERILEANQRIFILERQINEFIFDNEETCKQHGGKVRYICNNEYLPQLIYLCNQCILQITNTNCHKDHQIVCKKHRQPIKWMLTMKQSKQIQIDDQLYICRQCWKGCNSIQRSIITKCHFNPVKEICLESQCIQMGQCFICEFCEDKHQEHEKAKFDKLSLMEKFSLSTNISLSEYGWILTDIKERLKLRPVVKMVGAITDKMWSVVRLIESFNIEDYDKLNIWVDLVIEQGQKEDLSVLWGIGKIRNLNQQQRQQFLEVFNDKLQQYQQYAFSNIWAEIQMMGNRINKLLNVNDQQIKEHLNNKYRKIQNNNSVESRMSLLDVSSIHCHRIQEIIIENQQKQTRIQRLNKQKMTQRITFFNYKAMAIIKENVKDVQMQKKIYNFIAENQHQYQINHPMFKQYQLQQQKNKYYYPFILANILEFRDLTKYLLAQLKTIEDNFQNQCRKYMPLEWLFENKLKLTNLQVIHIFQNRKFLASKQRSKDYSYSVSVFILFKTVYELSQLVELKIVGVEVQHAALFKKCIMKARASTNEDVRLSQKEYTVIGNWMQLKQWLHNFNPKAVAISIDIPIQIHFINGYYQKDVLQTEFFIGLFKSVSDVTVSISMQDGFKEEGRQVEMIMRCISPLNNIKLKLTHISSIPLLKFISSLTNIQQLEYYNTFFPDIITSEEGKILSIYINKMFQNNMISALTINNSQLFLDYLETKSIKHLKLMNLPQINIDLSKFVRSNPQLKTIILHNNVGARNNQLYLPQLQELEILKINFNYTTNYSNLRNLRISSLKILELQDKKSVAVNSQELKGLFGSLNSITELTMNSINFSSSLLMLIPSPHLKSLRISYNDDITNEDIRLMDCKWPYITRLLLWGCQKINWKIFKKCKFRGLSQLAVNYRMLNGSDSCLIYLCKRGIKVK